MAVAVMAAADRRIGGDFWADMETFIQLDLGAILMNAQMSS